MNNNKSVLYMALLALSFSFLSPVEAGSGDKKEKGDHNKHNNPNLNNEQNPEKAPGRKKFNKDKIIAKIEERKAKMKAKIAELDAHLEKLKNEPTGTPDNTSTDPNNNTEIKV